MSKKVLIVDDSPTEIQAMKNAIESGGYDVLRLCSILDIRTEAHCEFKKNTFNTK